MKGKSGKGYWNWCFAKTKKLGLPAVFLLCSFFFLSGFFASTLLSLQDTSTATTRSTLQESVNEGIEYNSLTPGETGDNSVTSIPFQILSWKPRALYFPSFATPEQCQGVIDMAEPILGPSTVALRPGETEEDSKGIRTSSGVFISAAQDKNGILDIIEEKIAKVTMLPRVHGEEKF